MVASLPKTRRNTDAERRALAVEADALRPLRDAMATAVERDAQAYDQVVAAYKLPKGTDAERMARVAAVAERLAGAAGVPLEVMRLAVAALGHAVAVAANGGAAAASDVGVAVELLGAALRGASLNVDVNLDALKDQGAMPPLRAERNRLRADGDALVERVLLALRQA
jgi:glutamate formiminotransferase/formiminotetrahydrofolate cyclodeaminase